MKVFLFLIILLPFHAHALLFEDNGRAIPEKSYVISSVSSFFMMTDRFDINGASIALQPTDKYIKYDNDISYTYGFSKNLEIYLGARFRLHQSTHSSGANTFNLSSSGIERVFGGANYYLITKSSTRLAVDAYFGKTMYKAQDIQSATVPTDSLALGDGGGDFWIGTFFYHKFSKSFGTNLYANFRMPPNNLSKEINYKFELELNPDGGRGVILAGGVQGIYSLRSDQFTNDVLSKPVQATGVSKQYNSLNRSLLLPYLKASYRFDNFLVSLFGGKVISGISTDSGLSTSLTLSYFSSNKYKQFDPESEFREYETESKVIEVSPRQRFVKIDQGLADDIEKGMRIDIFDTDHYGKNKIIARGYVFKSNVDKAIIKITKKYKKIKIKIDNFARGYSINE